MEALKSEIPKIQIEDVMAENIQNSEKQVLPKIELYAKTQIPLELGLFDLRVYHVQGEKVEHVVISKGDCSHSEKVPFVRIHSECFTGEVLSSLRCDCKPQLEMALKKIEEEGCGMVLYLRNHEGRGIGLGNKIRAYELQSAQSLDTVKANHALGFPEDLRDFRVAAQILKDLGVQKIRLNTNNPRKASTLREAGIEIVDRVPSLSQPNPHNENYLKTKFNKLGHHLGALFEDEES